MLTFRKRRSLVGLGLVLVGALLLAGCSPSSPAPNNDGPPSNGGEVYSQFMGSWRSPVGVVPAVEFTVGDFIDTEDKGFGIHYNFNGEVKCSVLPGGTETIGRFDPFGGESDWVYVLEEDSTGLTLFVSAGSNEEPSDYVSLSAWFEDNQLVAIVQIHQGDEDLYLTPYNSPDRFIKQ